MKVDLIAIDMDGTLLNNEGKISAKNLECINRLLKKNIIIVPATGRAFKAIPEEIRENNKIKYAISSNGALVTDMSLGKTIYTDCMEVEKALKILDVISSFDIIIEAYINGNGYFEEQIYNRFEEFHIPQHFRNTYKNVKLPVKNLRNFIIEKNTGIEKINMPWLKEGFKEKILKSLLCFNDISITSSLVNNLEINNKNVSKGKSLKALCNLINILPKNVVSFGDSHNDIEMLKFSGISVAMENAEKEVKNISKYITLSNNESGVSYGLNKICRY